MKNLRIVHCANFSESKLGQVFYSIDRKISNGLIRNEHFVYDFSYREVAKNSTFLKRKKLGAKKMNEKLISVLKHVEPDLLLLGHSELIHVDTLERVKGMFPDIKIAMWWVDPFDRISHIDERIPYLDAFFATTSPEYYAQFFSNKTKFFYMPNMCDASIESSRAFENESFQHELIFIGREDEKRKAFINQLYSLPNIKVEIFGNDKKTLIYGKKFLDTIANTKMAINFSRYNDIPLYSSDRVIQLTAQGTLVFCPKIPEFENIFSSEELVYFNDFKELASQVDFYSQNDAARIEVAKRGWIRAHTFFNSTRVTKGMLEKIF